MNNNRPTVTVTRCDDCIHKTVCSYKEDFHDICNAVAGADVHKYLGSGKVKITNVLAYKDILQDISVKCKHFQKDSTSIPPCYW